MTKKINAPFQGMSSKEWTNLALASMLVFYIALFGLDLFWKTTCGHLAIDYCVYWSAGQIANAKGLTAAYDLELMNDVQRGLFPAITATSPTVFLPIFVIPFQMLALFNVHLSFWVWTILNLAALIIYIRFFSRKMTGQPAPARLLVMTLISFPVFMNIFTGQVNVWLTICIGEFLRAAISGKPFHAGLWLGGLLLKPQTLILIGLVLLLQRSTKIIAGLIVSSLVVTCASFTLINLEGMRALLDFWTGFAKGAPTNDVEIMVNWRMLGLHLSAVTSPTIGWIIAGTGIIATILVAFWAWRKPIALSHKDFSVAFLGLLAATSAATWHSHIHMMMIAIPVMIYLYQQNILPENVFAVWVFLPSAVYFIFIVAISFIQAGILPAGLSGLFNFLRGASGLGLNLYILFWATQNIGGNNQVEA